MTIDDLMGSLEAVRRELEYRLDNYGDHGLGEYASEQLRAIIDQVKSDALAEMRPIKVQTCKLTLPERKQ